MEIILAIGIAILIVMLHNFKKGIFFQQSAEWHYDAIAFSEDRSGRRQ